MAGFVGTILTCECVYDYSRPESKGKFTDISELTCNKLNNLLKI